MKLTIDTIYLREKVGDEAALYMIKEAGFDGVDYSMCGLRENTNMLGEDYIEKAHKTKEILDKTGLICDQAHAPFTFKYTDTLSEDNAEFLGLTRSIEYASIIGAKNLVVHYIKNDLPLDEDFDKYNIKFFRSFIPYLEKHNMKISVENLYPKGYDVATWGTLLCDPEKHLEFMEKLNSPFFNICLDIGHTAVVGFEPADAIRALGKNIAVMHIHDTDYKSDLHTLPYISKHNWDEIAKALADIDYQGNFNMEICLYIKKLPDELLKPGLAFAEKVGRQLIKKVEEYKKS